MEDRRLRAGAVFTVLSEHPDCIDPYRFDLLADGATSVRFSTVESQFLFRAEFESGATANGNALLAVSQHNPVRRTGDLGYHGGNLARAYTFRRTTPPFLLSRALAEEARQRQPIALHFCDFLDERSASQLVFHELRSTPLIIDGESTNHDVLCYADSERDLAVEIVCGTRLVRRVARGDEEFAMTIQSITTV